MITIKEILKNKNITNDISLTTKNEKLFEKMTLKIPFEESEAELYEEATSYGFINRVYAYCFHSTRSIFYLSTKNYIYIYDLLSGGIQGRIPIKKYGEIAKLHHFANRNLLCGIFERGKQIIIWDALTFTYLFNFRIESKQLMTASASTSNSRISTSEESTTSSGIENYLFLAYEKRILVVDLETRTINNLNNSGGIKNKKMITVIAVHPKMPILATCSIDGEIRLWDYQAQSSILVTDSVFQASQSNESAAQMASRRYTVKFDRTGMFLVVSATDGNICAWGPPKQLLQQLLNESLSDGNSSAAVSTSPSLGQSNEGGDGDRKSGAVLSRLSFYGYYKFENASDVFDFEFCDNTTQFLHFFSPIIMVLSRKGDISTWKLNFARKSSADPCIVPFDFINKFSFGVKQDVLKKIAVREIYKIIVHPTKNFMMSFPFGLVSKAGEYYAKMYSFSVDDVSFTDYIAPLSPATTSTSFNYSSEYALFLNKQDLWGYSIMGNDAVKLRQAKPQSLISTETLVPGISFPVKMVATYEQKVCAIIYKIFGKNSDGDCDIHSASYKCTLMRTESSKQSPDYFPLCRDLVFCGKNDENFALLSEDGCSIEIGQTQLMSLTGEPMAYSIGENLCVEKMFHMSHSAVTGIAFLGCVRNMSTNTLYLAALSRDNEFKPSEPIITFEKASISTVTVRNSCDPETLSRELMDEIDILLNSSIANRRNRGKKKIVGKKAAEKNCGKGNFDEIPVQIVWQKKGVDEIGAVLTSYQRIYLVDRKTLKIIRVFDFGANNCQIISIHWVGWALLFTTSTHLKAIYLDGTTESILSLNTSPTYICGVLPDRVILSTNNGVNGTTVYSRPISLIDPLINAEVSFYQEFLWDKQDINEISCRVKDIAVHFDWQRISTRTASRLSDAGIEDAAFSFVMNDTYNQTESPCDLIAQSIRSKHYESACNLIAYSLKNAQEQEIHKEGIAYLLKSVLMQNVITKEVTNEDLIKNLIKCFYLLNDEDSVSLYDFLHFDNFDLILKERVPCPVDPTIIATYRSITESLLAEARTKDKTSETNDEEDEGEEEKKKKKEKTENNDKNEAVNVVKPSNVTHGSRAVPSVDGAGTKPSTHQSKFSFMWVDTPGQWFPLSVIENNAVGKGENEKAKLSTRSHRSTNVISELRYVNSTCNMPVSFTKNDAQEAEPEIEELDYPALGIDDNLCSVDESLGTDACGDDDSFLLTSYGPGSASGISGYATIRHYGSFSGKGASSPVSSGRGSVSSSTHTMRSMQNINKMRAKSISSDLRPKSPLLSPSKKSKV